MYEELYSRVANALVEDGYIVVQSALDRALTQGLLEAAQDRRGFKRAGLSDVGIVDTSRRGDSIRWLERASAEESQFLEFAQGLQEYLNRTLFLGLLYFEAHFALYEEGAFYEKHFDSFKNSKNRVVTMVYYLNEEWKKENGGELLMYGQEEQLLCSVTPNAGVLAIFLSEEFAHEVTPCRSNRHSIAGWFRVDKPLL